MARRKQQYDPVDIRERMWAIGKQLNDTFVQRTSAIKVMLLAYLSGEHYLLIGEPGTAKTAIAERFAQHIEGAKWFGMMMGSFTTPEKVWGPLDISAFQNGEYKYVTSGKLPEAHIAFLDEFFKCNDGCLNEMLTLLNERTFDNKPVPLMTVGTATNWPELNSRSDNVSALYDRILLRCIVDDITEKDHVIRLLENVNLVDDYKPETFMTLQEMRFAIECVKKINVSQSVRLMLHSVRERLFVREVAGEKKPGVQISARRIGRLQKVLQAHAWLNGRDDVTLEDFECLQWGLWNNKDEYETARSILTTLDAEMVHGIVKAIDEGRGINAWYRFVLWSRSSSGYQSAIWKTKKEIETTDELIMVALIEAWALRSYTEALMWIEEK